MITLDKMKDIFPLADKLRPLNLNNFVGQEHLTDKNKIITSFVKNRKLNSIIFWGPTGTGKTSLSRILVNELKFPSIEFSATISGIS